MAGELTPERVFRAMARPRYCDELEKLGVQVIEAMGPMPGVPTRHVFWPPDVEPRVSQLVDEALGDELPATPRRRTERGRTEAEVSTSEAEKVARIYMEDRGRTPYAVWARYNPGRVKQDDDPKLLSKNMVAYLVVAIDRRWLGWDASHERLVISGEFQASQDRFVIPRRKPAS